MAFRNPISSKQRKTTGAELGAFILVFLILTLLIGAILYINFFTTRNITNLQTNTRVAAVAFHMNATLQEIVNQTNQADFSLRKKILQGDPLSSVIPIEDTLRNIRFNVQGLKTLHTQVDSIISTRGEFFNFLEERLLLIEGMVGDFKSGKVRGAIYLSDHERDLNDSIYRHALLIQSALEQNLSSNMGKGILLAEDLGKSSRIFSMVVVLAFAILGTVLLLRLLKHDKIMRELQISKMKTEELSKVKDDFLANMSHEIRTPLHAIMGYTDLLKSGGLNEKQSSQIDILRIAGQQLYSVVNDMLDVAKLEDGKLRIEKKPFDLPAMLTELQSLFEPMAVEKGIELRIKIDDTVAHRVMSDPVRIRQILYNLMSNSIKFTEKGYVELRAAATDESNGIQRMQFDITDTGIGIDPKYHQAVFDRFEQVAESFDNAHSTGQRGTGLGLSIVQGLVQLLNGNIQLSSVLNRGTHFRVILPLEVVRGQKLPGEDEITDVYFDFSKLRLLIAEDNQINQFYLESLFRKWKVEWALAVTGKEVIELLKKDNRYDLVFMDLRMPEMNGEEALKIMKETGLKTMPVIAMTAHAQIGDDNWLERAGFDDKLNKPFDAFAFAERVKRNLPEDKRRQVIPENHPEQAEDFHQNNSYNLPPQMQARLYAIFAETFPANLKKLETAIMADDHEQSHEITHMMAGSLAVFGPSNAVLEKLNALRDAIKRHAGEDELIPLWKVYQASANKALDFARKNAT